LTSVLKCPHCGNESSSNQINAYEDRTGLEELKQWGDVDRNVLQGPSVSEPAALENGSE
jgi:hypothetical protein